LCWEEKEEAAVVEEAEEDGEKGTKGVTSKVLVLVCVCGCVCVCVCMVGAAAAGGGGKGGEGSLLSILYFLLTGAGGGDLS
jgi:hypothetical protein